MIFILLQDKIGTDKSENNSNVVNCMYVYTITRSEL